MIRAIFFTLSCAHIVAAAAGPVVRASIASPRPIIVGQAVRVDVSVLVPNYFMGEPGFPQLNMENAIVVLPGETPRNSNETIAGQTYAGITVTYLVYPQQPGSFALPKADISVKYAADPPKSVEVQVALPAVTFEAVIPAEAADLDYFLPTTSLVITQKFDKPLDHLKVGDTLTRTVTITASKLRAMLIPPTKFEGQDGIIVYPKQPSVDDIKTDRGEFVQGRRIDTATYLIRKEGNYTIPPIQVQWWNLDRRKVQTAALPAIHFNATPNPGYNPELPPEAEQVMPPAAPRANPFKHYLRLAEIAAIALLAAALVSWLSLRFGTRLVRRWRESRRAYRNSEAAFFARLEKASRAGKAQEAYSLLLGWLNRFRPGLGLRQFLANSGDAELTREVESLASTVYGHDVGRWSGGRMIGRLELVRSRRHREMRSKVSLPPLNPVRRV
ncbi:MAG TPA: BatD family protein [Bryobacteraceae bacterium]|jgi:hypothetical protein